MKWTCELCTLDNDINYNFCLICDAPKTEDILNAFNNFDINDPTLPEEERANEIEDDESSDQIDYYMKWTCELCNSVNEIIYNFCLVCDAPKPEDILNAFNNFDINDPTLPEEERLNEIENDETFDQINNFCQLTNTLFADDSFPPSDQSIGNIQRFQNLRRIVWLRPSDILTRHANSYEWDVFRDPSPLDIKQGAVGNCWLISCIALVAERPDILEKIILTKTYNPYGIYKIKLCINGIYESVYIDDHFPCNFETREMLFVQGRHNQLWPSLIEKALAKILGNYEALISGFVTEGLSFLTGAPCERIETKIGNEQSGSLIEYEKHEIWSKLCSAKDANFLIGASCGNIDGGRASTQEEFKAVGLVKNHAYSILDVRHYKGNKLVLLRNPWDDFTWKGEWGRNWPGWTDASRRDLQFDSNNQKGGTFWISFDNYLRYFNSIEFAYLREHTGWKEQRHQFEVSHRQCEAFYLTITERTEICFNLFQRGVGKTDAIDVIILVHKNNQGQPGELVAHSKRKQVQSIILEDKFYEGGDYILIVISITAICNQVPLSCALAVYSSKPITIIQQYVDSDIYRRSLIPLVLNESQQTEPYNNMFLYTLRNYNGFIIMAENYSEELHFQIQLNATNSTNVNSSRKDLIVADSIPPMHRQLLLILTTANPNESSYFSYRSTYRSSQSPCLHSSLTRQQASLHSPSTHLLDFHATTPIFD